VGVVGGEVASRSNGESRLIFMAEFSPQKMSGKFQGKVVKPVPQEKDRKKRRRIEEGDRGEFSPIEASFPYREGEFGVEGRAPLWERGVAGIKGKEKG